MVDDLKQDSSRIPAGLLQDYCRMLEGCLKDYIRAHEGLYKDFSRILEGLRMDYTWTPCGLYKDSMWTTPGCPMESTRNKIISRQNTRQGIAMAEFPSHFHHQFDFVNKIYIILQQYSYIYGKSHFEKSAVARRCHCLCGTPKSIFRFETRLL